MDLVTVISVICLRQLSIKSSTLLIRKPVGFGGCSTSRFFTELSALFNTLNSVLCSVNTVSTAVKPTTLSMVRLRSAGFSVDK